MRIWLLFLLLPTSAFGKVLNSSNDGFTIEITSRVATSPAVSYRQFLAIDKWWLADHTYFGSSKNLSLTPHAGGCFCEIEGDKEVLHMTVTYVDPEKELRMIGGLGPLQMMAIHGAMSWKFEALENGGSKIVHRYQVIGSSSQQLDQLAPIVDKVQSQQFNSLVELLKKHN